MTPKAKAKKKRKKIDKLDFCVSKDSINQVKRQPTAWDKYLQIIYPIGD